MFLDEFQDTTDLQYEFIKTLFLSSPVVITAVGDDKQRIMDFAGARKTIFLDFKNDFSADELHLSVNHRSAPQIINLQLSMYKSLQEDYNEVFYSGKWNKNESEISLIQSLDDYEEAKKVAQDIMGKIHQGIKPNEIVILVKQRAKDYAPLIIDALKEKGIKARIESDYQSLIKEPLVKIILHSVMLSSTTSYTEDWQKYLSLYMESQGISDVEDERIIYNAEKALNEFLKSTSLMLNNKTTVKKLVQCIIDFWTIDFFQTTFPEYLHGSNLEETITSFINLMELEYQSGESWTEAVKSFVGDNSIPIMTIHKSKGLEFKAVYLIALDDNAFWSFKCDPDATRRALFVAISRAKQYLTFTFSESRFTTKHPGRQTHVLISEFYELIKRFVN